MNLLRRSFYKPRIAIIGGGPAGLTAGILLHKRGIPFTIFELRQKPTIEELKQPTGMLDLHEESGLAAIRKCDLFDDFIPLTGDCAPVMRISDKDGNIFCSPTDEEENRPEISRSALSQLLISKLPEKTIKWGHKLRSASSSTRDGHTEIALDFGTHEKQTFDLVIGADGAWSRLRTLLTDVKPDYSGRHIITLTIKHITKKYPHLVELVGPGTFFALGNRHGVSAQRGSQDSTRVYIFISTPEKHFATTSGLSSETAARAKSKILGDDALLGQWGTKTKELVTVAFDEESTDNLNANIDIRPVYELPIGHIWEHKPGTALIGDAAHLMPPSGEGVNIAMWDAVMLSQAIIGAHETTPQDAACFQSALNPLIKEFEEDMAVRAKKAAEDSRKLNETLFAEDAVTAMGEFFKSFGPAPE